VARVLWQQRQSQLLADAADAIVEAQKFEPGDSAQAA
jgi:hypothetical protein